MTNIEAPSPLKPCEKAITMTMPKRRGFVPKKKAITQESTIVPKENEKTDRETISPSKTELTRKSELAKPKSQTKKYENHLDLIESNIEVM